MPNPMYLKVMDMTIQQYQSLSSSEKEEFAEEAKARIADISADPDAYTNLTDVREVPQADKPEFTRRRKKGNS